MGRGTSGAGGGGKASGAKKQEEKKEPEFVPVEGTAVGTAGIGDATNTKEWLDGLTAAEKQAISLYTGSWYQDVNGALRSDKSLNAYDQARVNAIDSAIAKSEIKKPIVVYRGSTNDLVGGYSSIDDIKSNLVGKTIQDKGYMSTSVSKDSSFGGNTYYRITIPTGKGRGAYVKSVSHFSHENEFLLKRGTNFLVTGVTKKKSGQPVVHLQVVD